MRHERCVQNFSQNVEGKLSLGRSWLKFKYNIKMDLEEINSWETTKFVFLGMWFSVVSMVVNC